ncbi:plasmid pRiA4b ORF-3 family protein [Pectobacterium sp. A5351]|uniref:plasmid pRiA4b ORF-3 family protein n=1 Tax=Pectobacterium sp. A5351 TaxID=2914983 RepID=UPI00232EA722|nr:plasmid pRiA4b ORF-3 family protein [Pectobacterium sp. A5351]WCG81937.1 plasmid pRiA4b ORF-3 family protein [Pectobacterium sp. A5351]
MMSLKRYQLKISLLDSQPTIWRRVVVPANITLDRLHDVLQITMGWEDHHLHEFIFKKQLFTYTFNDLNHSDHVVKEESLHRLDTLLKRKGNSLRYIYDFGDSWEHVIELENSAYSDDDESGFVHCLDGEGGCPPEDCGGIHGYFRLCEILNDPEHEEHEETLAWLGIPDEFRALAPEFLLHFDENLINSELFQYAKWSRDRALPWFE